MPGEKHVQFRQWSFFSRLKSNSILRATEQCSKTISLFLWTIISAFKSLADNRGKGFSFRCKHIERNSSEQSSNEVRGMKKKWLSWSSAYKRVRCLDNKETMKRLEWTKLILREVIGTKEGGKGKLMVHCRTIGLHNDVFVLWLISSEYTSQVVERREKRVRQANFAIQWRFFSVDQVIDVEAPKIVFLIDKHYWLA